MKNLLLVLAIPFLILACGKNNNEDHAPQFKLFSNANLSATQADTNPIKRDDDKSGPEIKIQGESLDSLTTIDKKLVCGPLTINARRAQKGDPNFLTFNVSEMEFHGFNQLPLKPTCSLEVTGGNDKGSTVTRSLALNLKFDSSPKLNIIHTAVARGNNPPSANSEILLEQFEISNPFLYSVNLYYKPNLTITYCPRFNNLSGQVPFVLTGQKRTLTVTRVTFDATPPQNNAWATAGGYTFKMKPGDSITIKTYGKFPENFSKVKSESFNSGGSTWDLKLIIESLGIAEVNSGLSPALSMAQDFELAVNDISSASPAPISTEKYFPTANLNDPTMCTWTNLPD